MKCHPYCFYPYHDNKNNRSGLLLPFVGGLLVGGIAAPLFIKNNYSQPNYTYYPAPYPYYQYGYPVYQNNNYTYPYQYGYYKY